MSNVLNSYQGINLNNYDEDDLRRLQDWAELAYQEIDNLQDRLDLVNARLEKINYFALEA